MARRIFFLTIIPFIAGSLGGLLLFLFLPKFPLTPDNPVYDLLGIRKVLIIGFQPYWLLTRADKDDIPFLTDLTYFGLTVSPDGHLKKLTNSQEEDPGWTWLKGNTLSERLKAAKKDGLTTTLLLSSNNESDIAALLADPTASAQNMMDDALPIMKKFGYSNLNLDIESFREASDGSKIRFTEFVRTTKHILTENGFGKLSVDCSPSVFYKNYIIDPAAIAQYADYIVIMAYDYNYSGSFLAGPVAPLSGAGTSRETDVKNAVSDAKKVIPSDKIIMGIPLYGYEWDTLSEKENEAVIPNSATVASNRRIADLLNSCKNCTRSFNIDSMSPYLIYQEKNSNYHHQVYYEDKESLAAKLRLAQQNGLAGVALWALGYEGNDMLSPLLNYKNTYFRI